MQVASIEAIHYSAVPIKGNFPSPSSTEKPSSVRSQLVKSSRFLPGDDRFIINEREREARFY